MSMWECPRCGGTLTCYCTPRPTKKEEAMTEFDPSKPVMTVDGRSARVICVDRAHAACPIVALILTRDGIEAIDTFTEKGRTGKHGYGYDLVNIPESKWMNLYDDPKLLADAQFYTRWSESRADADKAAFNAREVCGAKRVAIVERTASGEFITTAVEK